MAVGTLRLGAVRHRLLLIQVEPLLLLLEPALLAVDHRLLGHAAVWHLLLLSGELGLMLLLLREAGWWVGWVSDAAASSLSGVGETGGLARWRGSGSW